MIRTALILIALAAPVQAEIVVPSGRSLEMYSLEVIPQGDTQNLLFIGLLAPQIITGDIEAAEADMDAVCTGFGLPEADKQTALGVAINEITIRLASQPLGYGESDPEVVQFMSFYDISQGECAWH